MEQTYTSHIISLWEKHGVLFLQPGASFRDRGWDYYWGNVQKVLRSSQAKHLRLFLSKCEWADPLPMMALATEVFLWRLLPDHRLEIHLPDLDDINDNQKGFLAFIAKEGFLDILTGYKGPGKQLESKVVVGLSDVTSQYESHREQYLSLTPFLIYRNPTCIPCTLFDLRQEEKRVSYIVDEMMEQAEFKGLKKYLPRPSEKGDTTADPSFNSQELRQIIVETLRNIKEHAYDDKNWKNMPKPAVVYGRIRFGLADELSVPHKEKLKAAFDYENTHCPRLEMSQKLQQTGFVELFVSDCGLGITHHIDSLKKYTHPLKVFFSKINSDQSFSRYSYEERSKRKRSPMPGLKYITDMLSDRNGFLRILHGKEWSGSMFPMTPGKKADEKRSVSVQHGHGAGAPSKEALHDSDHTSPVFTQEGLNQENYRPIQGSYITVRMTSGALTVLPESWNTCILNCFKELENSRIFQAWHCKETSLAGWQKCRFFIHDDQAAAFDQTSQDQDLVIGDKGEEHPFVLWRPSKSIYRDELIRALFKKGKMQASRHIIIADLDFAAALMVKWALNHFSPPIYFERITIITDTLCHCDLVYTNGRFQSPELNYFSNGSNHLINMGHIVYALREIDTRLFWKNMEKNTGLFIRGNIKWEPDIAEEEGLTIKSFVNFLHTANNPCCRWIYKRSMARFLAYMSPEDSAYPLDHVVESIFANFSLRTNVWSLHSSEKDTQTIVSQKRPSILLGSILVSGKTASAILDEWQHIHENEHAVVAHFLGHENILVNDVTIPENAVWLLRWTPVDTPPDQYNGTPLKGPLERIVDSPLIGIGGNRHWKMIRKFSENPDQNFYGCSPDNPSGISTSDAYAFWQARGLIRFGHWVVGGHHDCIGLDLIGALRMDYVTMEGPVWGFIKSHFDRVFSNRGNPDFPDCDLLACPANEGTILAMERMLQHFGMDNKNRIVLLPMVQRRRKAMRLRISPLDAMKLDYFKEKNPDRPLRVLLFDLVISSERTFSELKNLLRAHGADEVYSMALLDRSRLPNFETVMTDEKLWKTHARLWRFDLDYLASADGVNYSSGCVYCDCIEKAGQLLAQDLPAHVAQRIRDWRRIGKAKPLEGASEKWGLRPCRLPTAKLIKFGLESDTSKSTLDNVDIKQSAAFSAILLELMTITGRHDLVQKYVAIMDNEGMAASSRADDTSQALAIERSNTKIQLLISQFVYLRADIAYQRRINICRQLLQALFENPYEDDATAFAAMVFLSLDATLVKGLLSHILHLTSREKINTNLDFHLVASHLINGAGETALMNIRETRGQRLLLSMSPLLKPLGRTPETLFPDLFMILGDDHANPSLTMLYKLLNNPEGKDKNIVTIHSILCRLSHIFNTISENVFILPKEVNFEEFQKEAEHIAEIVRRINTLRRGQASPEIIDTIFSYLKSYLYRPAGLCERTADRFVKNYGQTAKFLDKIIDRMEGKTDCPKALPEESECKYCDTENVSVPERQLAKALITRQVEDCIEDVINAVHKKIQAAYDQCLQLNYVCGIGDDLRINFEIRFPAGPDTMPSFSSANAKQLENLGGEIVPRVNDQDGAVVIRLPRPIKSFVHSEFKTPPPPFAPMPQNPYPYGDPAWGNAFYGRSGTLDMIYSNIFQQSYLIEGEWRVGKTSLLHKIREQLFFGLGDNRFYIPVYFSLEKVEESGFWFVLYQKIHNAVTTGYDLLVDEINRDPEKYTYLHFMDDVNKIADHPSWDTVKAFPEQEKKLVVIVDEAQRINSYTHQTKHDLREVFSQDEGLKPLLSLILSGHGVDLSPGTGSSPWSNFCSIRTLAGLKEEDFMELIKQPLEKTYQNKYKMTQAAIEAIRDYSHRVPYDAKVICNLAFNKMIEMKQTTITKEQVEAVKPAALDQIFKATDGLRGKLMKD